MLICKGQDCEKHNDCMRSKIYKNRVKNNMPIEDDGLWYVDEYTCKSANFDDFC